MEANPDVEIAVEVLPWADRNTKLVTARAAGALERTLDAARNVRF